VYVPQHVPKHVSLHDSASHQRLQEIFAQIRLHSSQTEAHRVWEVVGKAPAQEAILCYHRFASSVDKLVFAVMRSIAFIDALWVPILLCYGNIEWAAGPFAPGGLLEPWGGKTSLAAWMRVVEFLNCVAYIAGTALRLSTSSVDLHVCKEYVNPPDILDQELFNVTFWFDAVSVVGNFWWAFSSRWVAAMRLLRLWRLPATTCRAYEIAAARPAGFVTSCLELLGSVWLLAHFFGCSWFMCVAWPFDTYEDMQASRPDRFPTDLYLAYLQCLGEGVALTVGWNGPKPSSPDGRYTYVEQVFFIFVGPVAAMFLAFIFARLLVALDHSEEAYGRFNDRMIKIASILNSLNMPPALTQRVMQYHAYLGVHNLDRSAYEMLFAGLSWNLHVELKLFLFEHLVLTAPFFQEVPPPVVMSMVKSFELRVFSPGDMVVKKGEVGGQMFFIVRGAVDIMIDDEARVKVAEKGLGDYFGEVALVMNNQVRTAWVCANTFCVLAELTRIAFEECMRHAPDVRQGMLDRIRRQEAQAPSYMGHMGSMSERTRQATTPSTGEMVPLLQG